MKSRDVEAAVKTMEKFEKFMASQEEINRQSRLMHDEWVRYKAAVATWHSTHRSADAPTHPVFKVPPTEVTTKKEGCRTPWRP